MTFEHQEIFSLLRSYESGYTYLYLYLLVYEQAFLLDPNNAIAHFNQGFALEQLNRKKDAQHAYEKARQLGYNG